MSAKQFVRDKQYQDAIQTLTEAKKLLTNTIGTSNISMRSTNWPKAIMKCTISTSR